MGRLSRKWERKEENSKNSELNIDKIEWKILLTLIILMVIGIIVEMDLTLEEMWEFF